MLVLVPTTLGDWMRQRNAELGTSPTGRSSEGVQIQVCQMGSKEVIFVLATTVDSEDEAVWLVTSDTSVQSSTDSEQTTLCLLLCVSHPFGYCGDVVNGLGWSKAKSTSNGFWVLSCRFWGFRFSVSGFQVSWSVQASCVIVCCVVAVECRQCTQHGRQVMFLRLNQEVCCFRPLHSANSASGKASARILWAISPNAQW